MVEKYLMSTLKPMMKIIWIGVNPFAIMNGHVMIY